MSEEKEIVIESLTEEQKARVPYYRDKWLKIGTDTSAFTQEEAEAIIHPLQETVLEKKKTPVLIAPNPPAALRACYVAVYMDHIFSNLALIKNSFKEQIGKQSVKNMDSQEYTALKSKLFASINDAIDQ